MSEPNGEKQKVDRLVACLSQTGQADDPLDVIDLYTALKSKPLLILTGRAGSGKIAFIQCLGRILMGSGCERCQMMLGHPWWAGGSESLVTFTTAQTRFNVQKLLALIDEAGLPENRDRLFIGCLARISPGELDSFFESIALQIAAPQAAQPGPFDFVVPGPWPANLLLVGTLDAEQNLGWNESLLTQANVFHWTAPRALNPACAGAGEMAPGLEKTFLQSAVRSEDQAYRKLRAILIRANHGHSFRPFRLLLVLTEVLEAYQVPGARHGLQDAVIYLANAWSQEGEGLFHQSDRLNLICALDRAIARNILPRAQATVRESRWLRSDLHLLLRHVFPRSEYLVQHLSNG